MHNKSPGYTNPSLGGDDGGEIFGAGKQLFGDGPFACDREQSLTQIYG